MDSPHARARAGAGPGREQEIAAPGELQARDLAVHFGVRRSAAAAVLRSRRQVLRAVDGVSLSVRAGEVLALAGESGSGKTTLSQAMVRNLRPAAGSVLLDGTDIGQLAGRDLRELRRKVQVIFQDPYESLNPRHRVRAIVGEGLRVHGLGTAAERRQLIKDALADVGLVPAELFLDRFPHELSGGQRQRVAIASCLVLRPRFMVADEPVSMLDVSVGAGILRLFDELRRRYSLGILMITHDLATAAVIADRIAIMYLGRIVEVGVTDAVLSRPRHPYTQALLAASGLRPGQQLPLLSAEPPDPGHLPAGCRFRPRCPLAQEDCQAAEPELMPVADGSPDQAACWHSPAMPEHSQAARRSSACE